MTKQPERSRGLRSRARTVMCCAGLVAGTMLGVAPAAAADGPVAPHSSPITTGAPVAAQPNPLAPCLRHAVQEHRVLRNIRDVENACPQPTGSPNGPVSPRSITGSAHYICGNDCYAGPYTVHASACTIPANLILAYQYSTCDGGANEVWAITELSNGYDEIVAYYSGHLVCATVDGDNVASGTHLSGTNCDSRSIPPSEQWRRPENTPDNYFNGDCGSPPCAYFIVPSQNWGLTWNIQGGGSTSGNIVLYGQSGAFNDAWSFY